MDANQIKEHVAACFRGEAPLCAEACPLRVDVRGLVEKISRGDLNGAYRLYRSRVIFPGIVARVCGEPCRAACALSGLESPLNMAALERACVFGASSKDPVKYNLPLRKQRVAVIGAGLSGLACALRLAAKKYSVAVYDRGAAAGGRLWDVLPAEAFLPEIETQFAPEKVEWHFSVQVDSLEQMEADALYVATGAGGQAFGLNIPGGRPFFDGGRTFAGGGLAGAGAVEALAHGARAAQAMEAFLKSGGAVWENPSPTGMRMLRKAARPGPYASVPEPESGYSPEEAKLEAGRCLRCDCGLCGDVCDLMRHYNRYPRKIGDEVYATLNTVDFYTHRVNTRFISSCNLCGLCGEACPTAVDAGALMQKARNEMRGQGALPPVFHDYWLRDMSQAAGADAELLLPPAHKGRAGYLFFPGCQLGASSPDTVRATYAHLRDLYPGTGIFLECCGAPALWAGDAGGFQAHLARLEALIKSLGGPKLAAACPSCLRLLRERLPGLETCSIYELLDVATLAPAPAPAGEACVFDPCSSRALPGLAAQVRRLAASRVSRLGESPYAPEEARCCGWGGHIYPANPEYARALAGKRAAASPLPYITYCSNCRDTFAYAGKPSIHLLDLLFRPGAGYADMPPSLTQRRKNRRLLRQKLLGSTGEPIMETPLFFSPELLAQLDRDLLLEDDLRRAIEHCESSGCKVLDESDGSFTGHLILGAVTCWVRYRQEHDGFTVLQAYSHRLRIVEEA